MTGDSAAPVAVRYPLGPGPPVDPFALAGATGVLFHAEGRVLVGLGTALTIGLPGGLDSGVDVARVGGVLASIGCEDRFDGPSSGVVGFASLPFDRTAPAAVMVPDVVYGAEADGRAWVTVVAADRDALPSSPEEVRRWLAGRGAGRPAGVPRPPRIEPRSTDASFMAMVADALDAIGRGELVKVVLARQVDVAMGSPVDIPGLLRRWHELEPNCTIFSLPTPDGQFVGASPELLVERNGNRIRSRPLAGTAERFVGAGGSLLPRELLESPKDAAEHRLVVEAIEAALRPLAADLDAPSRPDLVHLRNIVHLGTSLSGTLDRRTDGSLPNAFEVVEALHPTPAVGGVPATAAAAAIRALEPEPRGHYAGPVGYVDAGGDGRWMVGIRAMTIDHVTARLAAGVGVVAGSIPSTELAEANLKLTAVLDALAPGLSMPAGRPVAAPVTQTDERPHRSVVG